MRSRKFTFTDYVLDEKIFEDLVKSGIVLYIGYGAEECPTTHKIHFQGWMYLKHPRTESSARNLLPKRHIEFMKSDEETNINYCNKDGFYYEIGKIPAQGSRTDISELKKMIKEGKTEGEIFEEQPGNYIRYHKGIEKAMHLYDQKRNWEMDVRIYWGPCGLGKTRAVYEEFNSDDVYAKMVGKWWDGYKGETCVLIDDFDPNNCFDMVFDFYLKLLDRYPMRVEAKGTSFQFRSKVIIISSNFDPELWFQNKSNRDAFFRRVKCIKCFGIAKDAQKCLGNTEDFCAFVNNNLQIYKSI